MPLRIHRFAALSLLTLVPQGVPSVASHASVRGAGGAAAGEAVVAAETGGAGAAAPGEYVVAFDASGTAITTAMRTVYEAGGTILDLNRSLGVALVRAVHRDFLADVRRGAGIEGAGYNHAVGASQLGMPHLIATSHPHESRGSANSSAVTSRPPTPSPVVTVGPGVPVAGLASVPSVAPPGGTAPGARAAGGAGSVDLGTAAVGVPAARVAAPGAEPLADRQWNMAMIGATGDQAHRQATGAGVDVGIIDTGIDPRHPDIAPNYDALRSRNFTTDRPELDGPCEVPSCVDPPNVDGRGHGTHVAGVVAAARNGVGMAGVAPDARLVSLRAGQDSGYFFLYETVDALTAAGDLGLDVVNMSFYTDPWLYNCTSRGEYLSGAVTDDELAQQRLTRELVTAALEYAHQRGVTLIAASGNEHTDLVAAERVDQFTPGPGGAPRTRTLRKSCINLPSEGPHVVSVGAVGPSGAKADYSNWGYPSVVLVAPGGWSRDRGGAPAGRSPRNLVLSAYPQDAAIAQGLASPTGAPVGANTVRSCDASGATCGLYTYLQGTSMAAPHVVGVAALIVQRHGAGTPLTGYSLAPDDVAALLARTAADHPCPAGGAEDYTDEGRPASWNARCVGGPQVNELYGEGIVDAAAATAVTAVR